jgi:cytoskeletal protein CcmA (bactofilin family)
VNGKERERQPTADLRESMISGTRSARVRLFAAVFFVPLAEELLTTFERLFSDRAWRARGANALTSGFSSVRAVTVSTNPFVRKALLVTQPVKQSASSEAPVVMGQGLILKASLHTENDVFLDGAIEGGLDVENGRLTIGPHGKVVANLRAREVDIQGIMTDNVESTERRSIRASGQLMGDVRTGGIAIESGALFQGKVDIVTRLQQRQEVRNGE